MNGRAQDGVARSAARLLAVQALYQMAVSGGSADAVVLEFLQHRETPPADEEDTDKPLAPADRTLFADLVRGVTRDKADLDDMLAGSLDESWPLERVELLLRAILACGAYELRSHAKVPPRVVISEYMQIADAFFDGKEPGLVNAVLDRLARVLRVDEMAAQ